MDVIVARIGKPHGIRGEMTVQLHTDQPDVRFQPGTVYATDPAERGPVTVTGSRVHNGITLIRVEGIKDRNDAETLRNTKLVTSDLAADDDEDAWHVSELRGCEVVDDEGETLGEVTDLEIGAAQDLLVVRSVQGPIVRLPFVFELVPEVDVDAKRIIATPPGGLFPETPGSDAAEDRTTDQH